MTDSRLKQNTYKFKEVINALHQNSVRCRGDLLGQLSGLSLNLAVLSGVDGGVGTSSLLTSTANTAVLFGPVVLSAGSPFHSKASSSSSTPSFGLVGFTGVAISLLSLPTAARGTIVLPPTGISTFGFAFQSFIVVCSFSLVNPLLGSTNLFLTSKTIRSTFQRRRRVGFASIFEKAKGQVFPPTIS
jgi:hypothetical protein